MKIYCDDKSWPFVDVTVGRCHLKADRGMLDRRRKFVWLLADHYINLVAPSFDSVSAFPPSRLPSDPDENCLKVAPGNPVQRTSSLRKPPPVPLNGPPSIIRRPSAPPVSRPRPVAKKRNKSALEVPLLLDIPDFDEKLADDSSPDSPPMPTFPPPSLPS